MRRKELPSQDYLNKTFRYDADSGLLYWRERDDAPPKWNGRWAGKVAGSANAGRVQVNLGKQKLFKAHRIIWMMVFGEMPEEIDHIDGDPHNNRLSNLRRASRIENMRNVKCRAVSGLKGVSIHRKSGLWRARVTVNGREVCTYAATAELASAEYQRLAAAHYGEFARLT